MIFSRFLPGFFTLVLVTGQANAQDAQNIIEASARVYANASAYSAEVDSRLIQLVFSGTAPVNPEVGATQYRRLQLRVKRPYGYWLTTQVSQQGEPAAFSVVARTDDTLPKQGVRVGGKFSVRDLPAEQFTAIANSRLGSHAAEDVVLAYFQANPAGATEGANSLGLSEADLIGLEKIDGRAAYRIVAKTRQGEPIVLWIEKESSLVLRSILQCRPAAPTATSEGRRTVLVLETLYTKQHAGAVFSPADFIVVEPVPVELKEFSSVEDMLKVAEIAPR